MRSHTPDDGDDDGGGAVKREQWMLEPPKDSDWASRIDPTKLRNRKFNTGMGARAPPSKPSGDSALWTETPEQKQQRLADEVMGVKKPATEDGSSRELGRKTEQDKATAEQVREYNVCTKLPSHERDLHLFQRWFILIRFFFCLCFLGATPAAVTSART
jgi:hypothetical protein